MPAKDVILGILFIFICVLFFIRKKKVGLMFWSPNSEVGRCAFFYFKRFQKYCKTS